MINEYKNLIIDFAKTHKSGIKIWIFVILVGSMAFKGLIQIPQIMEGKKEITRLTEQIEYEKERQKEVIELKGKVDSDEYIEKIASEKLGLIKSNAKIFVDVSGDE